MKKVIVILFLAYSTFAQNVHRVTNGMNLQTVIDNASSGDVILVEGGNYGNIVLDKKVLIGGTGYFLTEAVTPGSAKIDSLVFVSGSEGSSVAGLELNRCIIKSSLVYFYRNYVKKEIIIGAGTFSNISVNQNLLEKLVVTTSSEDLISSFTFHNNIVLNGFDIGSNTSGSIKYNSFNANIAGNEHNCYPNGYQDSFTSWGKLDIEFSNNILVGLPIPLWTCISGRPQLHKYFPDILRKNYFSFSGGSISLPNDNYVIPDINLLYLGYPTNTMNLSLDARNQLAPNSPARGAGENGTDCGAFGGDDPYILSGIPSIPSIYQLTVPSQVPQNGVLNVQIKAKTNN